VIDRLGWGRVSDQAKGVEVADLTNLESKLGEVTGLAMAAKGAVTKVSKLAQKDHKELVPALRQMKDEATETERRCTELAGTFEGKKTAIVAEARQTRDKGASMLDIYLDGDSDALDGFEFLTMAEAGEVGHWEVLAQMSERAGDPAIRELVAWALPIQQRHFDTALATTSKLAAEEDPTEES
jgi:hypothetical protein